MASFSSSFGPKHLGRIRCLPLHLPISSHLPHHTRIIRSPTQTLTLRYVSSNANSRISEGKKKKKVRQGGGYFTRMYRRGPRTLAPDERCYFAWKLASTCGTMARLELNKQNKHKWFGEVVKFAVRDLHECEPKSIAQLIWALSTMKVSISIFVSLLSLMFCS